MTRTILLEKVPGRLTQEEIRKFEPLKIDGKAVLKSFAIAIASLVIVSLLFVLGN